MFPTGQAERTHGGASGGAAACGGCGDAGRRSGRPDGPLFTDFENTAHGPVEYDLAWAPKAVSDRYRNADQDLVGECRGLVLAMVAAYRWRRDDQHPSGRQSGVALLDVLRDGPPWPAVA